MQFANARLIAETLMEGLGQNVGAVYTVSEFTNDGSGQYPVPAVSYVTESNDAGTPVTVTTTVTSSSSSSSVAGSSISGGQVTIASTVTVTFLY